MGRSRFDRIELERVGGAALLPSAAEAALAGLGQDELDVAVGAGDDVG